MVIGPLGRGIKLGIAKVGLGRGKDQPKQRRARSGKIKIAQPRPQGPVVRVAGLCLPRGQRSLKAPKSFGRKRGQKASDIAEMMRRGAHG